MSSNADEASPASRAGDEKVSDVESSPTLVPKVLKSAEPDLEVVVGQGDDMRTYHHHSILLASYSDYVDTMLSVPMREQETRRITFPDITPKNWEKILMMHQLNGRRNLGSFLNKEEAPVLLPLLDKYQFNDVLGACDALLADMFGRNLRKHSDNNTTTSGDLANAIAIAQAAHGLNPSSMELTRPKIAEFAVEKLQDMPTSLSSNDVEVLLLLVDDGNDALKNFIEIVNDDNDFITLKASAPTTTQPAFPIAVERLKQLLDRHISDPNKTREIIKGPSFADRLRLRTLQLSEQEEMVKRLVVKRLRVDAPPGKSWPGITGEYVRKDAGEIAMATFGKIAASKKYCYITQYLTEDGRLRTITIASCDLFGRAWIMTDNPFNILFHWENEFGSPIPPKYGWKKFRVSQPTSSSVEGDGPTLHYNIESRAY